MKNKRLATEKMEDMLKDMGRDGNINYDDVVETIKNMKILEQHKYKIWQTKGGKWKTYIPDNTRAKNRRLIERNNRSSLEQELIDYYKANSSSMTNITFEGLYPEWMEYRKLLVKNRTRNRNQDDYNKFYLGSEIIKKRVADINVLDVEVFLCGAIKKHNLSQKQYANMAIILRQVLNYAIKKEIIAWSPMTGFKPPRNIFRKQRKAKSDDEVFTPEEQKNILLAIENRMNEWNLAYLAIALNFQLGLRVGELVSLKWSDIENGYITIQRQETRDYEMDYYGTKKKLCVKVDESPKTDAGFRVLSLTNEAIKVLTEIKKVSFKYSLYDKDGYIFVNAKGRLQFENIKNAMETICKKLKIKMRFNHKIRKTVLSALIDQGINLEEIRRVSGHEDIETLLESYCFNRLPKKDVENMIEVALQVR